MECSPSEPGYQIPRLWLPKWGHQSTRTWHRAPKCCSFHPVFGPILVNASFITSNDSNKKLKSEEIQLETFLVSRHSLCSAQSGREPLRTVVSLVTLDQTRELEPCWGSQCQLGKLWGAAWLVRGHLRETAWVGYQPTQVGGGLGGQGPGCPL